MRGFLRVLISVLPCFPREIEQDKSWNPEKGSKCQKKFLPESCACLCVCLIPGLLPIYAGVVPIYAEKRPIYRVFERVC